MRKIISKQLICVTAISTGTNAVELCSFGSESNPVLNIDNTISNEVIK